MLNIEVGVLDLRPTQFAVGMREVSRKAEKFKKLDKKELEKLLESRPVPIVQSREGTSFIVDRHHFTRAAWEAGIEKVCVEVKADFSHLGENEFWEAMQKCRFVHLYDQFGAGPHPNSALPDNIRGLADDPYRSLAWSVRRAGGYAKTDQPFSDFYWADHFRKRVTIGRGEAAFKTAVAEALKLAESETEFKAALGQTLKTAQTQKGPGPAKA